MHYPLVPLEAENCYIRIYKNESVLKVNHKVPVQGADTQYKQMDTCYCCFCVLQVHCTQ